MKIVNLTKSELENYVHNEKFSGSHGSLSLYDKNTLIKIHYKNIESIYLLDDFSMLDSRIDELLEQEERFKKLNMDTFSHFQKLIEKLNITHSPLLEGIAMYRGYPIGVLMKYYENYKNLGDVITSLGENQKVYVTNRVEFLLYELINSSIYPRDIKMDNILINTDTLDTKIIDLDDNETLIEDVAHGRKNSIENIEKFLNNLKSLITTNNKAIREDEAR